jgi:hypothetical protein
MKGLLVLKPPAVKRIDEQQRDLRASPTKYILGVNVSQFLSQMLNIISQPTCHTSPPKTTKRIKIKPGKNPELALMEPINADSNRSFVLVNF